MVEQVGLGELGGGLGQLGGGVAAPAGGGGVAAPGGAHHGEGVVDGRLGPAPTMVTSVSARCNRVP